MTDRKTLYQGVSCAAWGCFFEYFDFTVNGLNILPAFVGYWLFLRSIRLLQKERRDLALLRPLGLLLLGWNLVDWACFFVGYSLENGPDLLQIAGLVVSLVNLYFHFQLFTDLAAIAAGYQGPDDVLDARLLRWRTWQTVFLTIVILMMDLPLTQYDWWQGVMLFVGAAGLVTGLCVMMALFAMRKLFVSEESSGD